MREKTAKQLRRAMSRHELDTLRRYIRVWPRWLCWWPLSLVRRAMLAAVLRVEF